MQGSLPPMRVCGECGTAWSRRATSCPTCGASPLAAREARVDPLLAWVRITASFVCRSCGQRSPLEGFDVDGTVTCAGCGLTQAFHVPVWERLFHFAHGLADLGFPLPQGRSSDRGAIAIADNPFFEAGETRSTFPFEITGLETIDGVVRTASLSAEVALGVPFCTGCKQPLETQLAGDVLSTRCTFCGATAQYRMPPTPGPFTHRPVAVTGDDARTDGAVARAETGAGGAVAIKCPSCNAGLEVAPGQSIAVCAYCRTSCRIPGRMLHALRPGAVSPRPFWAAFVGPSDMRASVLFERSKQQLASESSRAIEEMKMPELTREQKLGKLAVTSVLLLLVGLAFVPTILGMLGVRSTKSAVMEQGMLPAPTDEPSPEPEPVPAPEPLGTPAVVRSEWVQVPGCGCPEVAGGTELAYRMMSAPDASPVELSFAWVGAEGFPTTIAATVTSALPTSLTARDLALGVSCAPSSVVYASRAAVSIFERRTGALLANGPGDDASEEAARLEGPIAIRCARATVSGGRMRWTDDDDLPHEVPLPELSR